MKTIFTIFFLFVLNFSFPQSGNKLKFIPLIKIDIITDREKIIEIQKDNELEGKDFFIKDWKDTTNTTQKALFYRKDTLYIIFQLPNEDGNCNSFELSDNGRFITYTTDYRFGGSSHYEAQSHFQIIDLQNLTCLSIKSLLQTEDWEEEKTAIVSKCDCVFNLKNNILSIKRKSSKNLNYKSYFDGNCIASGKYRIGNGALIKIKPSH